MQQILKMSQLHINFLPIRKKQWYGIDFPPISKYRQIPTRRVGRHLRQSQSTQLSSLQGCRINRHLRFLRSPLALPPPYLSFSIPLRTLLVFCANKCPLWWHSWLECSAILAKTPVASNPIFLNDKIPSLSMTLMLNASPELFYLLRIKLSFQVLPKTARTKLVVGSERQFLHQARREPNLHRRCLVSIPTEDQIDIVLLPNSLFPRLLQVTLTPNISSGTAGKRIPREWDCSISLYGKIWHLKNLMTTLSFQQLETKFKSPWRLPYQEFLIPHNQLYLLCPLLGSLLRHHKHGSCFCVLSPESWDDRTSAIGLLGETIRTIDSQTSYDRRLGLNDVPPNEVNNFCYRKGNQI